MGKIGIDKVAHAIVCLVITAVIALLIYGASSWFGGNIPKYVCGAIGAIVALALGGAKEAYDKFQGREFDLKDLIADVVGVTVGFVLSLLM